MKQWIFDITNFFFPVYCPVCGNIIHSSNQVICLTCELNMPRTGYEPGNDNPVGQIFWGRVKLMGAVSLFRFEKGSAYQSLLHQLKYNGARHIGIYCGKLLGIELKSYIENRVDYIIPVPLHRKKERKRGFNQSELIAKGIFSILNKPVLTDLVYRERNTDSQTRKNRFERWENMDGVFQLSKKAPDYEGCSFLLIDDVVTTGATLEACSNTLLQIPGSKVFVATVACA